MLYIGIDNGTSSNGIGVVSTEGESWLWKTPVKKEKSYTKVEKNISRIDHPKLLKIFEEIVVMAAASNTTIIAGLERPMVNPRRFFASMSAMRAVESTLIALEAFDIPVTYLDSKEWQHVMLPKGLKGDDLKKGSLAIGKKLFPKLPLKVDADGVLIAEYLRRRDNRTL